MDKYADQRDRIIGSCTAIIALTLLFVFLRLLSRKLSRAGYWWDDLLTVIAAVFSIICCLLLLLQLSNGYARHISSFNSAVAAQKTKAFLRVLLVFEVFLHTATTIAKLSVLAFYYRIFPILRFRRLVVWIGGASVAFAVSVVFSAIFRCRPIDYAWDQGDGSIKGHCFGVQGFFIGSGSCNVGLNMLIFIIPMPLLWRLQVTVRQQIVLTMLFTLAGFVVIVSIIWVVVVSRVQQSDVTWSYVDAGIWSALEPSMAVICACIPSIRPLANIFASAPLLRSTLPSTVGISSSRRVLESGKRPSDGTFTELYEADDLRPLGHDVSVRGGRVNGDLPDVETTVMAETGISVRTDITLATSNRLYYNDRLY